MRADMYAEISGHRLIIQLRFLKMTSETARRKISSVVSRAYTPTMPQCKPNAASRHSGMPMSKPILVYTIISSFMIPWTDFVMAKMILNSGLSADWTVAIGLFNMLQRTLINNYFALFCAGGVLVSVPISILFIIMQKFYVEGITAGADKG